MQPTPLQLATTSVAEPEQPADAIGQPSGPNVIGKKSSVLMAAEFKFLSF